MLMVKSMLIAFVSVICTFRSILCRNHALFSNFYTRSNKTSIVPGTRHPGHQIPKLTPSISLKDDKTDNICQIDDSVFVDSEKMLVKVGAACSMEIFLQRTMHHRMLPRVLPELKQIKVGGAIVGAALESSSFRYGQFNDICKTITVLTGENKVLTCSYNSSLYNALAGSYGTLGRVLSAEVECMPAADNVLATAHVFTNSSSARAFINNVTSSKGDDKSLDFVDGIIFPGQHAYVIITACMKQDIPKDILRCHVEKHHSEFYYEFIQNQAQKVLRGRQQAASFQFQMPLAAFLFRYDRGAFWMAKPIAFSFPLICESPLLFPLFVITHDNPLCRFLFRRLFTTSILYRLLNRAHPDVIARKMVIMDVYVPLSKLEAFLQFINDKIPITTPLWICPVKRPVLAGKQWFSPHGVCHEEMMVDIGIYGRVADGRGKDYTLLLDQWCMFNDARKMLYSQHSYTKAEFWKTKTNPDGIYDYNTYQALRKKYHAEHLPDLFDKVVGSSATEEQNERKWRFEERLHWFISWLML